MKYIGAALLALTALGAATGLVPLSALAAQGERVWSVLLFAVAITVVAALANAASVFDMAAAYAARLARGRTWALWLYVVGLAIVATVFLSLDTTAVLLTPIVVLVTRRARLNPLPFAMTTVWLAHAGSQLLPVSNLTNLLAQHRMQSLAAPGAHWGVGGFLALSWAPALACAIVPVVLLGILYRRDLFGRFEAFEMPPARPHDRILLVTSSAVVIVLLPLLASGVPAWLPACGAALALAGLFAWRRPRVLHVKLLPWSFIVFASGLFAAVAAAQSLGLGGALTTVLAHAMGGSTGGGSGTADPGPVHLLLAASGAVVANLIDNLPAYLVLEPAAGTPAQLMALLVGVNAGAIVTPWASLATLLWYRQLRTAGVDFSWRRFMKLGLLCAPLTVLAAVGALALVD